MIAQNKLRIDKNSFIGFFGHGDAVTRRRVMGIKPDTGLYVSVPPDVQNIGLQETEVQSIGLENNPFSRFPLSIACDFQS